LVSSSVEVLRRPAVGVAGTPPLFYSVAKFRPKISVQAVFCWDEDGEILQLYVFGQKQRQAKRTIPAFFSERSNSHLYHTLCVIIPEKKRKNDYVPYKTSLMDILYTYKKRERKKTHIRFFSKKSPM
jgi:hypothetical protein